MTRQRIDPRVKAQVIAEWELGKSQAQIARELGISRSYVRVLTRNVGLPLVTTEKQVDIGELVYDLIAELARGARAIALKLQDQGWLERQSADHIAISLGVAIDKMAGLIGAIRRGEAEQSEPPRLLPPRDAGVPGPAAYPENDR